MKNLNEDIKSESFQPIYLLYGEERYLKKMYKDRLTKAMIGEGDTMNYNYFEGKGINTKEIIDLAETMPFFADRRVIVIENSGFFKNATVDLAEYLQGIPESTNILFVEEEIDKRGKMFKAVKEKGRIVELGTQDAKTLFRWIAGILKKDGKKIQEKNIQYLIEKVGDDMQRLEGEVEKLICYIGEREEVTVEDIESICTTQISNQIFDMVNAVADKRQKEALEYYYELLALKEPPMRILFLLVRQFRMLFQVKGFDGTGMGNREIAGKMGMQPFVVGKYQKQAGQFKRSELRSILEDAADTEEAVKTGRLTDKLGVELFIVKYSMS